MRSSKEKYIKFVLYILVVVLINVAGITLFFRIDMTRNKVYSLSDASKDVVATLSEPLNIKVFFSKNLPTPHNNTERYLKDLLEEYASKAGKYFNYTFYNVTPDEGSLMQTADENRDMARDYGVDPVQIQIMEDDEVKFKNAYMGLAIIHGDLIEKIPAITSTNGLEYQLTTAIQKLNNKVSTLIRLDKKVNISMYLSNSLYPIAPLIGLDQLPRLGQMVADTINRINNQSLGKLNFNTVAVPNADQLDTLAKENDLMVLTWEAIPDQNIPAGSGTAGIVIDYDGQTATLPLINVVEIPIIGTQYQMADPKALEDEINSIIEKMIGINKEIGFLTSHDSLSLTPNRMAMMQGQRDESLRAFNSLVSSRYTIKFVDLKNGTVPDGLNCLIIARPTQKFSDYELFQIDQALMKGTSIAFFSDSFKQIILQQGGMGMPPMHEPIDTGLEQLLNHYGVSIQKAYVLDEQSYKAQVPPNMGGGEQNIYFYPLLKNEQINTAPEFMHNIKGLVAGQISPLELVRESIDDTGVTVTKLLSSSDRSWLMKDSINLNPQMIFPPTEESEFTSFEMAYVLEGRFTSFFKGKAVPQKTTDEDPAQEEAETPDDTAVKTEPIKNEATLKSVQTQNTMIESGKPAKLFVLPSSLMIQDTMIDPQGRSMNAVFILNVIDHLNGEDRIAKLRAKQQTLNPIMETSPALRGVFKAFNIIGLPVLVILFGVGVLAKRTSRKKKLAKRFNDKGSVS